jgi:hypothetical protein
MRMFYIGLGFASVLLIALIVYMLIPEPAVTELRRLELKQLELKRLELALREHAIRIIPLTKGTKGDRLPVIVPTPSPPVVVLESPPLVAVPPPEVPEVKQAQADAPPHKPDLCERHHMRKVIIHGGRSWRCRRLR